MTSVRNSAAKTVNFEETLKLLLLRFQLTLNDEAKLHSTPCKSHVLVNE